MFFVRRLSIGTNPKKAKTLEWAIESERQTKQLLKTERRLFKRQIEMVSFITVTYIIHKYLI